jgi:hypothetical protein
MKFHRLAGIWPRDAFRLYGLGNVSEVLCLLPWCFGSVKAFRQA